MGLDEMKAAFCQQACPHARYLERRALLCKVRRKELANPYHDTLISISSLIVLVPRVQLIEKSNLISSKIRDQGWDITQNVVKGERHFHQTRNLTSASNKCLLAQQGRAS